MSCVSSCRLIALAAGLAAFGLVWLLAVELVDGDSQTWVASLPLFASYLPDAGPVRGGRAPAPALRARRHHQPHRGGRWRPPSSPRSATRRSSWRSARGGPQDRRLRAFPADHGARGARVPAGAAPRRAVGQPAGLRCARQALRGAGGLQQPTGGVAVGGAAAPRGRGGRRGGALGAAATATLGRHVRRLGEPAPLTETLHAFRSATDGTLEVALPRGRTLRASDRRLLQALAEQAAVAFRNITLEDELAARVEELDRDDLRARPVPGTARGGRRRRTPGPRGGDLA